MGVIKTLLKQTCAAQEVGVPRPAQRKWACYAHSKSHKPLDDARIKILTEMYCPVIPID